MYCTTKLLKRKISGENRRFFVYVWIVLLWVREERREYPGKDKRVQVYHNDKANAAGNKSPQFVPIVAGNTATKVIGNLLVPAHEGDTGGKDDETKKGRP